MATSASAPLAPLDLNRRYNIPTALALLGVSRKTLYAEVKAGKIRLIKAGRRSFISGQTIARLSAEPTSKAS